MKNSSIKYLLGYALLITTAMARAELPDLTILNTGSKTSSYFKKPTIIPRTWQLNLRLN